MIQWRQGLLGSGRSLGAGSCSGPFWLSASWQSRSVQTLPWSMLGCFNVLPGLRPKAMDPANLSLSPLKPRANINLFRLSCLGQLFCPSNGNLYIAHLIWCQEPCMHLLLFLISPTECYSLSGSDLCWISKHHSPRLTPYWCLLKEEMKVNEKVIPISSWWFDSIWLVWREPSEAAKSET